MVSLLITFISSFSTTGSSRHHHLSRGWIWTEDFRPTAIELVDDDDEIPEPIQQCADILLDLHDGYKITHVEYKVEEYDGSPCFFVQVFAVPLDDDEETNLTDDVFNKFYQIIMDAKQEVIEA